MKRSSSSAGHQLRSIATTSSSGLDRGVDDEERRARAGRDRRVTDIEPETRSDLVGGFVLEWDHFVFGDAATEPCETVQGIAGSLVPPPVSHPEQPSRHAGIVGAFGEACVCERRCARGWRGSVQPSRIRTCRLIRRPSRCSRSRASRDTSATRRPTRAPYIPMRPARRSCRTKSRSSSSRASSRRFPARASRARRCRCDLVRMIGQPSSAKRSNERIPGALPCDPEVEIDREGRHLVAACRSSRPRPRSSGSPRVPSALQQGSALFGEVPSFHDTLVAEEIDDLAGRARGVRIHSFEHPLHSIDIGHRR